MKTKTIYDTYLDIRSIDIDINLEIYYNKREGLLEAEELLLVNTDNNEEVELDDLDEIDKRIVRNAVDSFLDREMEKYGDEYVYNYSGNDDDNDAYDWN